MHRHSETRLVACAIALVMTLVQFANAQEPAPDTTTTDSTAQRQAPGKPATRPCRRPFTLEDRTYAASEADAPNVLYAPSGFTLPGCAQALVVALPFMRYDIAATRRATVGFALGFANADRGAPILGATIKYGLLSKQDFHLAVGGGLGWGLFTDTRHLGAGGYVAGTYGTRYTSVTVGLGQGMSALAFDHAPLVMIGGEVPLGGSVSGAAEYYAGSRSTGTNSAFIVGFRLAIADQRVFFGLAALNKRSTVAQYPVAGGTFIP